MTEVELLKRLGKGERDFRNVNLSGAELFSAHSLHEIRDILAATQGDDLIEKRHGAAAVADRVEALCAEVARRQVRQPPAPVPG